MAKFNSPLAIDGLTLVQTPGESSLSAGNLSFAAQPRKSFMDINLEKESLA